MKFTIGDRVKVIKIWQKIGDNHLGQDGIVVEANCDCYGVEFNNKICDLMWYKEDMIEPYIEVYKTYEQGLTDGWDLAKKICLMVREEREKIFNYPSITTIMEKLTVKEATEKIEQSLLDINVGDEVTCSDGRVDVKFIVTYLDEYFIYGLESTGKTREWRKEAAKKTGQHFEINDYLKSKKE